MTKDPPPPISISGAPPILASPVGPSPVSKLEYVTRLISYHDQAITKQNVLISELVQRIGALEEHAKQSSQENATLVQQNVELCQELNNVKKSLEKAHKAQAKQSGRERKLLEKQGAERREDETRMLQTGLLQADIDKLKRQVEGMQQSTEAMMSRHVAAVKSSIFAGMEQQLQREVDGVRSQVLSAVTSLRGEVEQDVACIRAESSASASSVEAAAMAANSLAMKLRNHMQACSATEAATTIKLDNLEKTVAGLSGSMNKSVEDVAETVNKSIDEIASSVAHLGADAKKVKKHVVKLERVVEGLQSLGHVAVAADKALQEVKRGCDQTAASVAAMMARSKEASEAVQSTLSRIAEVEAQMATATDMCASNKMDLGDMAESLGAAFQQLNEEARKGMQHQALQYQQLHQYLQQLQQQQQQQPTSYLQSLLGPAPLAPTSAMSMARMQLLGPQQAQAPVAVPQMPSVGEQPTWEAKPTEFDAFLRQFRTRSHNESSRPRLRSESPVHNGQSRGHRHHRHL